MKYHIDWCERKSTSTGKDYTVMNLTDEAGVAHEKVSIWSDNALYGQVQPGGELEGEIKVNGNFKNFMAPQTNTYKAGGNGMAKVMEKKQDFIEKTQDSKHEAIKLSGAMRDATLLTIEQMKQTASTGVPMDSTEDIKKIWLEWKKWLLVQHDSQPF